MYKAYSEKNDNPMSRTFMYMSLLHFFIGGAVLIYIERFLEKIDFIAKFYFYNNPIFWIIFYGMISLYTYIRYSRKSFEYYEDLFSGKKWLNSNVKIWMIGILPFLIFFGGILFSVILFGGKILGRDVVGFW